MTKEEFISDFNLEDETILLEPWEEFSGGIIGVSDNNHQVIYGYDKLVKSLMRAWDLKEDEYQDAIDWIEVNTLPTLPYLPSEFRPIICYEVMEVE